MGPGGKGGRAKREPAALRPSDIARRNTPGFSGAFLSRGLAGPRSVARLSLEGVPAQFNRHVSIMEKGEQHTHPVLAR